VQLGGGLQGGLQQGQQPGKAGRPAGPVSTKSPCTPSRPAVAAAASESGLLRRELLVLGVPVAVLAPVAGYSGLYRLVVRGSGTGLYLATGAGAVPWANREVMVREE
jgi:hypothetical protein